MPLYDIRCETTGETFERHIPLEKFEEEIKCACGSRARRVISAPMFSVDHTGYDCPVTGDWIGSKRQHEENLKKHGCRVLEAGEKEASKRRFAEADTELDRKLDATVEKTIDGWSSDKKEQLHNELVNAKVDLAVERK